MPLSVIRAGTLPLGFTFKKAFMKAAEIKVSQYFTQSNIGEEINY